MFQPTQRQKTFKKKLQKFSTVFNAVAGRYTVPVKLLDQVRDAFNGKSSYKEAEGKVRKLKKILNEYPEWGAKFFKERKNTVPYLPNGKNYKDSLEKFVAPMLRVL